MKCVDVTESMQGLHAEMGGTETFSESAVASDLAIAQIERRISAELHVLLRVKETLSDVFRFNQSDFLIVSSQTH